MRVSCLQENLARGLSVVSRAVSNRSTLPVLANISLNAEGGRLKLAATNLEIGVNCWIGAKVSEEGATTVPARLLADFVSRLPPEQIDMDLTVRTQTLNLHCARTEAHIKGIDASEFPLIPTFGSIEHADTHSVDINLGTLRQMIAQVAFAAATDDSRPSLTGVLAQFQEDKLTLVATDGFRLSVRTTTLDRPVAENLKVVIPARSLQELARIGADADEEQPVRLMVTHARNQVLFHMAGKAAQEGKGGAFQEVDLVSQLIDTNFPDYRNIIPKNRVTRTVVDTRAFRQALQRAEIFARDSANIIRLNVAAGVGEGAGHLTINAISAELGDNEGQMDALIEGEPVEIAFNARYLLDVVNVIETPQVAIETLKAQSPGVVRPVGTGPEEFSHILMPMHISK